MGFILKAPPPLSLAGGYFLASSFQTARYFFKIYLLIDFNF